MLRLNSTSKLHEPHLATNEDHYHDEAIVTSGGMVFVDLLDPIKVDPSKVLAEAAMEGFSKMQ